MTKKLYEQRYIKHLFDSIYNQYDFLNHLLSGGIDFLWRRKAINLLKPYKPKKILDVATGTADLAIEAAKLYPEEITGIDISEKMLEIGKKKISAQKLDKLIKLDLGKAENLAFKDNVFDAVISSFGVRNFENLELGLKEIFRVLHSSGVTMILEFSIPNNFLMRRLFCFYLKNILPAVGGLISKRRSAYEYLNRTILEFPNQESFSVILKKIGFANTKFYPLTFGIATIYLANKP